jgi:hypothetical protein
MGGEERERERERERKNPNERTNNLEELCRVWKKRREKGILGIK